MRYRVIYAKRAPLRYTSVLDMQAIWEQSIRRTGIDLEYTSGFHPQPRIQIALPLPLGYTSTQEIIDFWTLENIPIQDFIPLLQKSVPTGIEIVSLQKIDNDKKSITNQIVHSDYELNVYHENSHHLNLKEKIEALMQEKVIIRSRRNKEYDLRPLIIDLSIDDKNPTNIFMRLAAQPGKTGRPDEVALALGLNPADFTVERIGIHFNY